MSGTQVEVVALDLPGSDDFVAALASVWERGDAAFPLAQRLPPAARRSVMATIRPTRLIGAGGVERRLDDGRPTEVGDALVVATSGSTGDAKGVVLTHDAVDASARATSARLGVTADDRWLACLPLSHVGGLSVVTRALLTGTPLTVLAQFDVAAVTAAATAGATLVSLVPTALARVDARCFRRVVLGGAAAPGDLPSNVVTTYGMTETGSGVVYDGRPLDAVELRIAADGELHLRAPMLLRAYRRPDGDIDALDDGWFATGDLGGWLPDGRLRVDGRRSDLIITGGENVWPEAVERVLARHPAVAEVVVAGTPDTEWGQLVTAYVVAAGDTPPTLDELRDAVAAILPRYCAPRLLRVLPTIPRTTLGKPRRAELPTLSPTAPTR